jgi:hypothetical protein
LRVRGKEKDTVRVRVTFLVFLFRYGAGRTGNDRVFARLDGKSDDVVNSNVHTRQDTSLATRNIWVSVPTLTAPTKVRIPSL